MNKILLIFIVCLLGYPGQASAKISLTWKDKGGRKQLHIKTTEKQQSITIDWGDGNIETQNSTSSVKYFLELNHFYSKNDTYHVTITAVNPANIIRFNCNDNSITSLDVSQCTALKDLECANNQLTSLDLSQCTALIYLSCFKNELSSLDVSKNTKLESISCGNNQLTSLEVNKNPKLFQIFCPYNQITTLNVTANAELINLDCNNNQLASLDFKSNPQLRELYCHSNQLTALDLENNPALQTVECYQNKIVSLDLNNNKELLQFYCDNNNLKYLNIQNSLKLNGLHCSNNQLASLNLSNNTALTKLYCSNNKFTDLNLKNNATLFELVCDSNKLASLDISNNVKLMELYCSNNQLTSLNLSNNVGLEKLICNTNQLTSLDLRNSERLNELICNDNKLSTLNVSKNSKLKKLHCYDNYLPYNQLANVHNNGSTYSRALRMSPQYAGETRYQEEDISLLYNGIASKISVENGVSGVDYTYINGILTFLKTGTYTVSMTHEKVKEEHFKLVKIITTYTISPWDISFTWNPTSESKLRIRATEGTNNIMVDWGNGTVTTHNSDGGRYYIDIPYANASGPYNAKIRRVNPKHVLDYLAVNNSGVTQLDVTNAPDLSRLYCANNKLQSLDLSNNKKIDYFECNDNQLSLEQLYDIMNNGAPYANSCIISPQRLPETKVMIGDVITIPSINGTYYDVEVIADRNYYNYIDGELTFIKTTEQPIKVFMFHPDVVDKEQAKAKVSIYYTVEYRNFNINATANNPLNGSIVGNGTYNYGETATLSVLLEGNNRFINWTDSEGNVVSTENPYTFTVTKDLELIAKLEPLNASGIDSNTAIDLQVYPNPVVDMLYINAERVQLVNIYNLQGVLVISQKGDIQSVDMGHLSSGGYIVIVKTANSLYRKVILKK
ncbi:Leucine-rich repeat (LRR) protein [Parabacteroides sp. PF5-5]|uniref:T9SS type A sorting domain-containing protein n=1 Tax=unclassified Parabacteroides TaxID=2649774 RepID=UPI0024744D40|nr:MULTISPECIES: T9SS type A sorting domain-containing protein [unclassified Parabacteroides]MDH6306392.1 Leucine-rich repeat (LRR) protein [Parabacteroides sp. PH5-39]MDH6314664.1 Leucine-rich repeat (LRR) protein [Parabacteroides sp. PF5-13]MDH6321103.1 Leucine-rich repeat (LRR) protein [Parabacteroides sp. PH5-13]MDH6324835.1 Leucine-rich repeat (LRR) protein [Parabacteroides sp. PH5-8]MDH6325484.1 Leucine-rich repeat (LRR) protein [Parabacteroides sp. PH5-41]